ncbi:hypothetical protein T458_20580 [Brevibacillus panacihumi W25]|uniref:Uncharacterized protein n=1 Tax=Brevibacillus panacihumi W25 TaxID=1408254 RepID=V6MET3_9BACL|nr:hypothetical protein T458_20580 [Brevibacillus panacihumi W25]
MGSFFYIQKEEAAMKVYQKNGMMKPMDLMIE